jgi:hypothetical protein
MSSDRVLFPELWGLVFSHLATRDLARVSQTSLRENVKSFLKSTTTEICTKSMEEAIWLTDMGCKTVNLNLSQARVADVSKLGKVHTLNLRQTQVTDVSMLGKVHTLNLRGTEVTDVSMLGNVHTLDIRDTGILDVSMLENVQVLRFDEQPIRGVVIDPSFYYNISTQLYFSFQGCGTLRYT